MKARSIAAMLFVVAVLVSACSKHAGGSCKAGESSCVGKEKALTCQGGKLAEVACNGPLGCTKFEDHANCDASIASPGDACMADAEDQHACTPDKKRALVCKGGTYQLYLECRGKGGCTLVDQKLACDTSIAEEGDPCEKQDALACKTDKTRLLKCQNKKFSVHRYCRGTGGCSADVDPPSCDQTLSLEQDPCGVPGEIVCSADGKTELVCQGGLFGRARTCKKNGCRVTHQPGHPIDCN